MRKRSKTYLLLAAVLVIWGILGFKVIKALMPDNEQAPRPVLVTDMNVSPLVKRDTFSIVANYRDPFLGTPAKVTRPVGSSSTDSTKAALPQTPITYSGFITDGNTGQRLFFLNINETQHLMSVGQEIDGITLVSGNSKQVRLREHGRLRIILLQQ